MDSEGSKDRDLAMRRGEAPGTATLRRPGTQFAAGARTLGAARARPASSARLGPDVCLGRDTLFRRALLVADIAAVVAALLFTVLLASREYPLHLRLGSLLAVPLLLVAAKLLGLYDRDQTLLRKTTLDETPKLFALSTLCTLLALLADKQILSATLDRREALFLWVALTSLLVLARALARHIALQLAPVERCLFIGDDRSAAMVGAKLTGHSGINAQIVARLDLDHVAPWSADRFSAPRLNEIRMLAETMDVQRAIIASGWGAQADSNQTLNLVRTLKAVGVRVSVLPRMLEVVGSSVEFDELHGVTLLGVRSFDLTRSSKAIKRAFDLLGASLGLLASSPLLIGFALAIKLDSRGPVFFRQHRVGRHGTRFDMIKFRTMVKDAESMKESLRGRNEAQEGLFKIADDPRVTRIGRFLRQSALDELPQLLNILRGEMSLVGPRPLVIDEDQRIGGWNRRRLELMPGMTGPWQILGPSRVPLKEMVALDYVYVANWSLWGDVKIILRTVPHVLGRHGL